MYLTESGLKNVLEIIYPNTFFIHDKIVPKSGIKNRPDYRNEELKLIVEFDGYTHYTQSKTIVNDEIKDTVYSSMGYKIVRIPYFVQISKEIIKVLFGVSSKHMDQVYPHGFIDSKCILPSDFCNMGIQRLKHDLKKFKSIKKPIEDSLVNKIKEKKRL